MKDDLLSIGAFAVRARLSQKALRLYDRRGLLPPARVDPATGYRSYRASQLAQARLILLLRELQVPLPEIGNILAADPGAARRRLQEHWQRREAEAVQGRRVAKYLDALLAAEPAEPSHPVLTKTLPAQSALSSCRRVGIDELSAFIRDTICQLQQEGDARGLVTAGPACAVFHGPVNRTCNGPVEICLGVEVSQSGAETTDCIELPARRLAFVRLGQAEARFPEILEAYDATWLWIQQQGLHPSGPPMEIYAPANGTAIDDGGCVEVARPYSGGGFTVDPVAAAK